MKMIEWLKQRWVLCVNHTPDCAETSRLASRSFEEPLLKILNAAAPRLAERLNLPGARGLSAEAIQRIVQLLQTG